MKLWLRLRIIQSRWFEQFHTITSSLYLINWLWYLNTNPTSDFLFAVNASREMNMNSFVSRITLGCTPSSISLITVYQKKLHFRLKYFVVYKLLCNTELTGTHWLTIALQDRCSPNFCQLSNSAKQYGSVSLNVSTDHASSEAWPKAKVIS